MIPQHRHGGWELPGPNQHPSEMAGVEVASGGRAARRDVIVVMPDWDRIAADHDAVHLSWAGMLGAEGHVVEVPDLGPKAVTMLRATCAWTTAARSNWPAARCSFLHLEQASRLGDRLVVAVNHDDTVRQLKGPDRPVNSLDRRMKVLAALACVDWVVPFAEETPERLICRLKPELLVKGGDNDPDAIPGADCVREAGGEVRVMEYVPEVSTTGLISSIRANDE